MRNTTRPTLAVFKFASDAGCQLEILNMETKLPELLRLVDIAYFPMAGRNSVRDSYDIGLVEGAITSPGDVDRIKDIRDQCSVLAALGSCACFGGLPSIKNTRDQAEVVSRVYSNPKAIDSIKAYGLDHYVEVDAYLKGCPVDKEELEDFLKAALLGMQPRFRPHSVCIECKLKENPCFFSKGTGVCMGPVTASGCGALCPSANRPCEGCRGPVDDPNAPSLVRTMKDHGATSQDIRLWLQKYAGETPAMKQGVESS